MKIKGFANLHLTKDFYRPIVKPQLDGLEDAYKNDEVSLGINSMITADNLHTQTIINILLPLP